MDSILSAALAAAKTSDVTVKVSGAAALKLQVGQFILQERCSNADKYAAYHSGEEQYGKIRHQSDVGHYQTCSYQLPEIVSHTAGHAYSHDAEKLCLVQGIHYQYAKYAASKGVYHAEEACEKEACSQYAYAVYYKSVFEAQSVYGDYYNQVGEAKFDSGNRYGHRYQSFDIG